MIWAVKEGLGERRGGILVVEFGWFAGALGAPSKKGQPEVVQEGKN